MVSFVIIITWHGNDICLYTLALLFYLHNYSNVYDIEITISTVQSFISSFVVHLSIIHGKILVVNN